MYRHSLHPSIMADIHEVLELYGLELPPISKCTVDTLAFLMLMLKAGLNVKVNISKVTSRDISIQIHSARLVTQGMYRADTPDLELGSIMIALSKHYMRMYNRKNDYRN